MTRRFRIRRSISTSAFFTSVLFSGLSLGVASLSISDAVADELPSRKPGLWQIDIAMEGMNHQSPSAKHCIDTNTDKELLKMGSEMGNQMGRTCKKNDTTKQGSEFTIDSDCTMAGSHIISHTVISGDFNSKYTTVTNASYDPPLMGRKESKTTVTSTWLGACEAGQQPGDMIMPGGMKMNINQLKSMTPPKS